MHKKRLLAQFLESQSEASISSTTSDDNKIDNFKKIKKEHPVQTVTFSSATTSPTSPPTTTANAKLQPNNKDRTFVKSQHHHTSSDTSIKKKKEILYCICKRPYDSEFMIMCDDCENWFHGKCVGITPNQASTIDKYYCDGCRKNDSSRATIMKQAPPQKTFKTQGKIHKEGSPIAKAMERPFLKHSSPRRKDLSDRDSSDEADDHTSSSSPSPDTKTDKVALGPRRAKLAAYFPEDYAAKQEQQEKASHDTSLTVR